MPSAESYRLADGLLHSRAFLDEGTGGWVLVPFVDLFNYNAAMSEPIDSDDEGSSGRVHAMVIPQHEGDQLVVRAPRAFDSGEQVRVHVC